MKALITGATGFIGSAVARCLIGAGLDVRALVRPGGDRRNLEGLKIEIVTGDLKDRRSLEKAVSHCSALFHVAADYRLWTPRPAEMYEVNVTGTRNIMLASANAGVARIVYTSSVATIGLTPDGSPADEDTPVSFPDMIGHYKRSKFLAEAEVRKLTGDLGLPAVIVNPSTPVGPRDIKPTPTGRMIIDAASGRMPAYVDSGLNLIDVNDVAAGHLLAMEKGKIGDRYILGSANMTLREIFSEIACIAGRRPPAIRLPHSVVLYMAYLAEASARITGREPRFTRTGALLARKKMFFSSDRAQRVLGFRPQPVGR